MHEVMFYILLTMETNNSIGRSEVAREIGSS